jgi:hypothetical protein
MEMEEGTSADAYFARVAQWYDVHSRVATWLVDQQEFILDEMRLSSESHTYLYQLYESHLYYLDYRWSHQWARAAQSFATRAPGIREGAWCYFIYAAWHRQCLQQFVTLLNEPMLRDSPWYARYQSQATPFQQIIDIRRAEHPVLEDTPAAQRAAVVRIQKELERLAARLAQEWREAVEWAAERLPWEQLEPVSAQPDASPPLSADDDDIPW